MRIQYLPIVAACLYSAIALSQQSPDGKGQPVKPFVAVSDPWPLVDLNVLVLDKEKTPHPETDAAQFRVLEDGAPQTILSLSGAEAPVSLGLVLDFSGSTCPQKQEGKRPCASYSPILNSLPELTASLPAGSEVMVATFADQAFLDMNFAPAEHFDLHVLDKLHAGGGTAFYDALVAAEDYFAKHAKFKRRAIVVVSDGEDNASKLDLAQAIQRISCASAPLLYAINTAGEHQEDLSLAEWRHSGRALGLLVKAAGGMVIPAYGKKRAPAGIEQTANAIRAQVSVQYSSTNAVGNATIRKPAVTMPTATDKLEIRYEKQFSPPVR
ncbi:MAG TPA: hypothetical protein VGJ21_21360 [Terracidiphilus sp.]|jgi:VWFA-related protein